jgi:hypothetical protein
MVMAMDSYDAMAHLVRVRDEASILQQGPLHVSDFRHWYDEVLELLSQFYGPDSSIKRAFEQIRFGFPPEAFQNGAELLRADLQQHGVDLPESFSIPLEGYYQKALTEAGAFLSSLISELGYTK